MKRVLFVVLLGVLGACRACDDRLVGAPDQRCGQACSPLAKGIAGVGACRLGTYVCDADGGVACQGYGEPSPEVCDDIDNDCDGRVDKFYEKCSNSCGSGEHGCKDGQWGVCTRVTTAGFLGDPLVPRDGGEICNGVDDDCDGIVDNNLPVVFCYDAGAPATAAHGVCHPGTEACYSGERRCENQLGPTPEVCDSIDNDCNGAVDDGLGHQYDFLFCIDTSGSMTGTIETVKQVVTKFGNLYNSADHHFALCRFDNIERLSQVWIQSPFTTAPAFISAINTLSTDDGYGDEASGDALWFASQPKPYALVDGGTEALNWRPGSRRFIILFSDELVQSFNADSGVPSIFDGSIERDLLDAGVVAHVWTAPIVSFTYEPDSQFQHDIYSSTLQQDLLDVLSSACE